jgi:hypothetical protein
MNEWWSSNPNQKFWVEITDRSDLGKNIIAPRRAQSGKSTPGYDLLNYVHEGDLIFHWWRKPSNSDNRGFYGYSEVVGQMQEGSIPWKSRGRYAVNETTGPKPAKYWNLSNFSEFPRPILIGDLNRHKVKIFKLIDSLQKEHGKPIYFPFCERNRKVAANQTYFAKLPVELLEILEIESMYERFINLKVSLPKKNSVGIKVQRVGSFSRQMDPEKRSTVENHAEKIVRKHLEELGYKVEKFGKPFDFLATKGAEKVKVEVKGKQDYATTVEVTVNEVEVAKNHDGSHRTLLAVVDGIEVKQYDGAWKGSGGRLRTWWDMPFDELSLFPTRFQFTLPVE